MNTRLVNLFKTAASSGELPLLLKNNSTFNIEFPTFGGEVFWDTYCSNGWKLQVNSISGWWRILNNENVRVARGTTEGQLASLLSNRPTSIIGNYLDEGYRFIRTQANAKTGKTVILVHGWGVRARSMQELAESLAKRGYEAYSYDYPSSERNLPQHCQFFLSRLRELLRKLPSTEKLHLLTHSMGGLVLRGAMAEMTEDECRRISAIVMLGPPNRGSMLALLGKIPIVEAFNASLGDMSPDGTSFVSRIPAPSWLPPVGIIAGRYDGKVSLEDTRLPEPLAYRRTIVDCTHPGLRNPGNVLNQILKFYSTQTF